MAGVVALGCSIKMTINCLSLEQIGSKMQKGTQVNTRFIPQFYKMIKSSVAFKATSRAIGWERVSHYAASNLLFRAGPTKNSNFGQLYSTKQELLQSGDCKTTKTGSTSHSATGITKEKTHFSLDGTSSNQTDHTLSPISWRA
jgi:hypothetical protein